MSIERIPGPPEGSRDSIGAAGRGALGLLSGSAVSALANFGVAVVVARLLTQQSAGSFFTSIALFALIYGSSRLAADSGLVRFVSTHRSVGEPYDLASYMRAALVPVVGVSAFLGVALAITGPWLSEEVLGLPDGASRGLLLWAVLIPFAASSDVLVSATRAFDTFAPAVFIEKIARPVAQLILTVWAAWVPLAVTSVVMLWALPYLGSALWAALWLRRLAARDGARQLATGVTPWREFWRFNWSLSVASWVKVALQRLDVLLISALRGPIEAAIYVAATRFLVLGQLVGNSFSLSVQPLHRQACRPLGPSRRQTVVLCQYDLAGSCELAAIPKHDHVGSCAAQRFR